jgi:hypothetical protein
MDTVERFYIYRETRDNNQINDKKHSQTERHL